MSGAQAKGFWGRFFTKHESPFDILNRLQCESFDRMYRQRQERWDRAIAHGFKSVYDPMTMIYADGFDRHAENEFMRRDWEAPCVFRLSDMTPYYNVAGLLFRPVTEAANG